MQLSGTPAAFAVVLLLNLNHNLSQCQTESRVISADCTLTGMSCQSGRGQWRKRRGAISQKSSWFWRIFVLDTEKLCSVSISEEMGPGGACVIPHSSLLQALLKARLLIRSESGRFDTNPIPNPKHSFRFLVVDFYLKWS